MKTPVVSLKNIFKSFNGITVLNDVDFELLNGEIHALMGGNGAGKSTLMKILEGVYTPDNGQIEINGQPTQIPDPQMAKSLGIGMVFQEFSLIPTLTVAQNIFLTNEPKSNLGFFSFINDALHVYTRRYYALAYLLYAGTSNHVIIPPANPNDA